MSPAFYAVLGVILGALLGPLIVFTIALCAEDTEELGRVLPGRWRR